ncbi:acyl-CoA dehydrogenase family protein [Mycobacterium sp. ACS4331]|uniref:acyl-CoA dehydrogenase family protein n=1 Tax=Mycobacterium sp. ACS4331 TaxID=1834121 RepID=UPI0007FD3AC1|nr:acyl-CoA dehydrogenase family protein [Mycobacterium sp. ACS4331]OBF17249.1 acyl-CoA dehydrogenase [Mycobacterium sp. ACS4331]
MAVSERDELRGVVRSFLQSRSTSTHVREAMVSERGFDDALWRDICGELGLSGIAVPEEWGGAGAGMTELTVVFEEAGAALLCSPLFATVGLAVQAVLSSGDREAMADLVPPFLDGSRTATVILNGALGPWAPETVTLTAEYAGGTPHLSGEAALVIDGHSCDVLLAAARTEAGLSLFAVEADVTGLSRQPLAGLDRTRRVARVSFDSTPARLIGADGGAAPSLEHASQLALVALAAEQLGGAQRCLDMAVGYARDRIQFGRPIGSFQAVKHRCADMLVLVEGARSAVEQAASVADGVADDDGLAVTASVAKMAASEAYVAVALDNMRVHGGIGFTWEHDAHLYMRRAKATELTFGSPEEHAQRLAQIVVKGSS